MRIGAVLCCLTIAAVSQTAAADSAVDSIPAHVSGNLLHEMCLSKKLLAALYIVGVSDTIKMVDTAHGLKNICLPKAIVGGQLTDVVCRHLQEHPEYRHNAAAYNILMAMTVAWPCQ